MTAQTVENGDKVIESMSKEDLIEDVKRLSDESYIVNAIYQACPGCTRLKRPGVIRSCKHQKDLKLGGECEFRELQPGIGAGVAVVDGLGAVLIGRRAENDGDATFSGAGKWCFPGGKCIKWSSLRENAARELEEEAGIKVDPNKLEFLSVGEFSEMERKAHYVLTGWLYVMEPGEVCEPKVTAPNEIVKWRWVNILALQNLNFWGPSQFMVEALLKKEDEIIDFK
jgi:8-oxo-dGTP pyrophosphatase MutT (NUDIX family)